MHNESNGAVAPTNYVQEALRAFGGITQAVVATGVSESTWHRYRRMGRIDDALLCFVVEEKTKIAASDLAGYRPGSGVKLKPRGIRRSYR